MRNNDVLMMAQKLRAAEEKVAQERGGFYLFGLFERQQAPGRWNLVASAPWLKTDLDGTKEIIALLRSNMDTGDWKVVSAVFPIDPSEDFTELVLSKYSLKHQIQEVYDPALGDEFPGHAFLITADKSPAPAALELAAA
jgi:hypothetical protein